MRQNGWRTGSRADYRPRRAKKSNREWAQVVRCKNCTWFADSDGMEFCTLLEIDMKEDFFCILGDDKNEIQRHK